MLNANWSVEIALWGKPWLTLRHLIEHMGSEPMCKGFRFVRNAQCKHAKLFNYKDWFAGTKHCRDLHVIFGNFEFGSMQLIWDEFP